MKLITMKKIFPAVTLLGLAMLCAPAGAQTTVALSAIGAINGGSISSTTQQSPSDAGGGMVEVRHISSPLLGYEATYSYSRANQGYSQVGAPSSCPTSTPCYTPPVSVKANSHVITGDWVPSLAFGHFRFFAVFGGGLVMDIPVSSTDSRTVSKPAFVYGSGLDWQASPHIGVRLQFRGNLYSAPDLSTVYTATGHLMQTSEPMLGVYYKF
jgi:opacity protein-like surface antigen